jgi:heme-degrading monooxygenase HmoA
MVARVTFAEVDAVRQSVARLVRQFEEEALPLLHEVDGYEGCTVLTRAEGKALVVTYWRDEAAAEASLHSGVWDTNVARFLTELRTPAGHEAFDVSIAELPAVTAS